MLTCGSSILSISKVGLKQWLWNPEGMCSHHLHGKQQLSTIVVVFTMITTLFKNKQCLPISCNESIIHRIMGTSPNCISTRYCDMITCILLLVALLLLFNIDLPIHYVAFNRSCDASSSASWRNISFQVTLGHNNKCLFLVVNYTSGRRHDHFKIAQFVDVLKDTQISIYI
jgi:hypothetical protein